MEEPQKKTVENSPGWIGVDLDHTLAVYRSNYPTIGEPVPRMLARVKRWLDQGIEVRIFTARAGWPGQEELIQDWCENHGLPRLQVTNVKTMDCFQIWDDRAVRVERDTGIVTDLRDLHEFEL